MTRSNKENEYRAIYGSKTQMVPLYQNTFADLLLLYAKPAQAEF